MPRTVQKTAAVAVNATNTPIEPTIPADVGSSFGYSLNSQNVPATIAICIAP